jgi:photosystem II stability/assembly factor-like uncharacterized protein
MALAALSISSRAVASTEPKWEPSGWGGGGFYYAAAFHPSREGVIYLAGDVGGLYRSDDDGKNWKMINKGLAGYGVFTLAVDKSNPDTIYAATDDGLCKSTDQGENWVTLPQTGPKELRITGEKNKSIRSVAVDPTDGNLVYAASPNGKIYKSADGGQTWRVVFEKKAEHIMKDALQAQFGKVNDAIFGGLWMPLELPAGEDAAKCKAIGLRMWASGAEPQKAFLMVRTDAGNYVSNNLKSQFVHSRADDVILNADDFSLDPLFVKEKPDLAAKAPPQPDLGKTKRIDFGIVANGPGPVSTVEIERVFFVMDDGGANRQVTAREFKENKKAQTYGNLKVGEPVLSPSYSVAVDLKNPSVVAAATGDSGIILSKDKGETWTELATPKKASNVTFDPVDANTLYGAFFTDGIQKSTDLGKTWTKLGANIPANVSFREVAVDPANPANVYAIGQAGWGGNFWISRDAGATWKASNSVKADYVANPTLPKSGEVVPLSIPTNVAINPKNPKQLYISANWRSVISDDAGETLTESMKGADISCITDIRFSGNKVYTTAMDEGTLVSDDQGKTWRQIWPLKHETDLSGHNWRVAVTNVDGKDRLISTGSPWDGKKSVVAVVSEDGGDTFKTTTEGIPSYRITANTMWGRGYPRALAVDPSNPKIVYMGIDGDPTPGQTGGGVFKSEDGGYSWKQLPNQPGSRRMYYGLAIDPTNPQRIYWASFGKDGGIYVSEDGGGSWNRVFTQDQYLFNIMTTADGTVYASGKQLYRSKDQGKTWQTLTKFDHKVRSIVGIEVHPKDPNTIWISSTVWNGAADGAVYKSSDGGATWNEITGNLPYIRPQILRFNPETNELWAGFVGLFKIKQ